jgi:uroporphyrinogen decarboxylase
MRQAGRYLREYRALREKYSFLEIARSPELVTQVTLMPVRMMPLDAAIIFADIALPFEGLGIDLRLEENVGPVIDPPVRTEEQIESLREIDPQRDVAYLLEGLRQVRSELGGRVPLIGFSGAPFTLASYLIEGRGKQSFRWTKGMMYSRPDLWRSLMERLTETVIRYLRAQVEAGAQALQIFDSWIGCLSPDDYVANVQPFMSRIFRDLGGLRSTDGSGVPVIHFGTDTATLLPAMTSAGGDVIGVDWRIGLDEAWEMIGPGRGIQGNLDPCVLLADFDVVETHARRILDRAAGRPGHVFNLGHGILPGTPLENVQRLIDLVHDSTRRTGD